MWVRRAEPTKGTEGSRVSPQKRSPVPRSSTMGSWPGDSRTTHEVLPPYRRFASHGHGVEPRTPKKLTLSRTIPRSPGCPAGYPWLPGVCPACDDRLSRRVGSTLVTGRVGCAAMELRPGTTVVEGLEIAYLEAGEGPLAVCLHRFPDS